MATRSHIGRGGSEVFPAPPLPGTNTIIPIRTRARLQAEGQEQHNCVDSYAARVRNGNSYIYSVLAPERATLAIRRNPAGTWICEQLKGSGNRRVRNGTRTAVRKWLDEHTVSL